jgi:hypothetical protein
LYAPRAVLLPEYSQVFPNPLGKYWLAHKATGVGDGWGNTVGAVVGVWTCEICLSGRLQADRAIMARISTKIMELNFLCMIISNGKI